MTGGPTAVLLDVDGTLLDTNHLHTVAWARALRRLGLDAPMAEIHGLIGMGGDQFIEELIGPDGPEELTDLQHEEFLRLRPDVRVLPGATDLIRALDRAGVRVVLASSGKEDDVAFTRELLDVDAHLAGATSADDAEASKPAPDILLAALDEVHIAPSRAMLVGDSVWDVKAGQAAGIGVVGVLTGGNPRADLVAAGATAVYEGVDELAGQLDASPLARLLTP